MKKWAKWQLLDYRVPNRHLDLRFDEIEDLIKQGEVGQSDLVCPPGGSGYQPVSKCQALNYIYTHALYDMYHDDQIQPKYLEYHYNLPINRRTAFVQENYFFSDFFKKRKLDLLAKCAKPLLKIMEQGEEINFIFSAEADINLPRVFTYLFPKSMFLETLVIITSKRIIQAIWNSSQTRAECFKSVLLENINHFQFIPSGRNRCQLVLKLYREKLFSWLNMNQVDRVQLETVLTAYLPLGSYPKVARSKAWIPNLCKSCYSELSQNTLQCRLCDAEYVDADKTIRLSRILPGLGLMHGGFKMMGLLWIGAEASVILLSILGLFLIGPESWRKALLLLSTVLLLTGMHKELAEGISRLIKELRPLAKKTPVCPKSISP